MDVMDGCFVPNISFGAGVIKAVHKVCDAPLDVHLMVNDPIRYAQDFAKASMAQWEDQVDSALSDLRARYENVVIAGHSMGCLLAIRAALADPCGLRALFLLAPPLFIDFRLRALRAPILVGLDCIPEDDEEAHWARAACSIEPNRFLPVYLGWISKENLALRRLFQAADHEQRGALAAAGRAEQPHQLSVRKFIIKIAHRNDILSPFAGAGELLGQVLQNNLHDSLYPLFLAPAHSARHGLTPML